MTFHSSYSNAGLPLNSSLGPINASIRLNADLSLLHQTSEEGLDGQIMDECSIRDQDTVARKCGVVFMGSIAPF
jgi:hypothetical protein